MAPVFASGATTAAIPSARRQALRAVLSQSRSFHQWGETAEGAGASELGVRAAAAPKKIIAQVPRLRSEEGREGGGGFGSLEGEEPVPKLRQLTQVVIAQRGVREYLKVVADLPDLARKVMR